MNAADVRPPNLAGAWYPGDAQALRALVEGFLAEAAAEPDAGVTALVVPHAGYAYSGRTAGAGYARIPRARWRRAAIVAPSHFHSYPGAAVFPGRGLATPLGVASVDRDAAAALVSPPVVFSERPFAREHSVEIQLPFLQVIDADLAIVPILVGAALGDASLDALAAALGRIDDGLTLFVVSSDFTHFGAAFDYLPFPPAPAESLAGSLRELDFGAIDRVCRADAHGFAEYVGRTGITVCGRAPLYAFLRGPGAALAGRLLAYRTSLELTGDTEHSVSYASIAFENPPEGAA